MGRMKVPTVFTIAGIRFYFYSNDHLPIHIHVQKADAKAKVQVDPEIKLLENNGFSPAAIKKILKAVEDAREIIIDEWEAHFND
jgi:hypothetical protein